MLHINFTHPDGSVETVATDDGETVMKTALNADVAGIVGECGGALSCATCHVYLDLARQDGFVAMSDLEDDMLEGTASERRPESRLSCQLRMSSAVDGVVVEIPEEQL